MKKICLNMIVKDEAKVILRCLESVKKWIDYWVIVDTGSTDGTQKIIREALRDIPGELYERAWVNFESNRNEALQLARNLAEYCLFIDADDQLICSEEFRLPDLNKDCYYVNRQLKDDSLEIGSCWTLLVRNALAWKWRGVIHEEIVSSDAKSFELISGLVNRFHRDGRRSQDPTKALKDVEVLMMAIQREPENSRYVFYLAEALKTAGDFPSAIENYKKAAEMKGVDSEEAYWSLYWIGNLQDQLKMDPSIFLESYYRCYLNRPSRAEPLCDWANFYIKQGNYLMAYLLSEYALSLNGPEALCCKKWVYDWALLLQYYTSADHLGKQEEAKAALSKLFSVPSLPPALRAKLKCDLENR